MLLWQPLLCKPCTDVGYFRDFIKGSSEGMRWREGIMLWRKQDRSLMEFWVARVRGNRERGLKAFLYRERCHVCYNRKEGGRKSSDSSTWCIGKMKPIHPRDTRPEKLCLKTRLSRCLCMCVCLYRWRRILNCVLDRAAPLKMVPIYSIMCWGLMHK